MYAPPRPAPLVAGIEGLRGLCVPKAVAEDAVPWLMRSTIPPPWQVPLPDIAFPFGTSLVTMFYGPGLLYKVRGEVWEGVVFEWRRSAATR